MTTIIPTSTAEHIGMHMKKLGASVMFLDKNKDGENGFPDGEIYTRISGIKKLSGKRVVVLHSGMPAPNRGLVELFSVLRTLNAPVESKEVSEKKFEYKRLEPPAQIEVFFLYFPYGMQDKIFQTGESNMAEHIMHTLVNCYGVKRIYAVDLHCTGAGWLVDYPVVCISAEAEILSAMRNNGLTDIVQVAPDLGSQMRLGIKGFDKKRKNSFEVDMHASEKIDVKDKVAVVWDDLIETGGTMARAREKLLGMGAKKVFAAATHGVMPAGVARIKKEYPELYLSNTIDSGHANVDVSGMVLEAIKECNSVSSER